MERHGKFCTYCNRKTLHTRQGEGSLCTLCGTYAAPTQEEVSARLHRRMSDDALRTIEATKRVRAAIDEEDARYTLAGKIGTVALVLCAILFVTILGGLAWIFLN